MRFQVPFGIILFLPLNYFISIGLSELACKYWAPEKIDEEHPVCIGIFSTLNVGEHPTNPTNISQLSQFSILKLVLFRKRKTVTIFFFQEKASLLEKLRQFVSTPPRRSLYVRSFCAVLLFIYSSIANAGMYKFVVLSFLFCKYFFSILDYIF